MLSSSFSTSLNLVRCSSVCASLYIVGFYSTTIHINKKKTLKARKMNKIFIDIEWQFLCIVHCPLRVHHTECIHVKSHVCVAYGCFVVVISYVWSFASGMRMKTYFEILTISEHTTFCVYLFLYTVIHFLSRKRDGWDQQDYGEDIIWYIFIWGILASFLLVDKYYFVHFVRQIHEITT